MDDLLYRLRPDDASLTASIASEVGIPIELRERFRYFDLTLADTPTNEGGKTLPGDGKYVLRFFGVSLDVRPESGPAWNPVIPIPDFEDNVLYLLPGETWLQPYRVYMFAEGSPIIGQMTWNPTEGMALSLIGLEHPHTERDIKQAWRGLKLMKQAITRVGRRVGSTIIQSVREVLDAYEDYQKRFGANPSQEELATHMGFSDSSTLKRYLRNNRRHIQWPPSNDTSIRRADSGE
jgi:hypothetical protein